MPKGGSKTFSFYKVTIWVGCHAQVVVCKTTTPNQIKTLTKLIHTYFHITSWVHYVLKSQRIPRTTTVTLGEHRSKAKNTCTILKL